MAWLCRPQGSFGLALNGAAPPSARWDTQTQRGRRVSSKADAKQKTLVPSAVAPDLLERAGQRGAETLDGGELGEAVVEAAEDDLGLFFAELGLGPALGEEIATRLRVAGDGFFERLHLAEDALALFLGVRPAAVGAHRHREFVHGAEKEERFLRHALFQAGAADKDRGFHQRAGGVAQQPPVNGEMDVGLQTGAVEKYFGRVDRLGEVQRLRRGGAGGRHGGGEELLMYGRHRRGAHPLVVAFEGAFARGFHAINFPVVQEPLQEAALGDADGKFPEAQARDKAREVAPQGQGAGAGKLCARLRAGSGQRRRVFGGNGCNKRRLDSALVEERVDLDQLSAKVAEFHRAVHARKCWTQGGLISEDRGGLGRRFLVHPKNIRPEFEVWNGNHRLMPLFFLSRSPLEICVHRIWDRLY